MPQPNKPTDEEKLLRVAIAVMIEDVAIAIRHPGMIVHSPDIIERATARLNDMIAEFIGQPMTPKLAGEILEAIKASYGAPRPFGVR